MVNIRKHKVLSLNWEQFSYSVLDSTNEEIKKIYDSGKSGIQNLIVISDEQTSGKGRYGRKWMSPSKSGMYASWGISQFKYLNPCISLVLALLCVESIKHLFNISPAIKWPNDIVVENKKLGGILIEQYRDLTIFGIGINITQDESLPPTSIAISSLCEDLKFSFTETRNNLIDQITKLIEEKFYITDFNISIELEKVKNNFLFKEGDKISVESGGSLITGSYKGLNSDGEIIIEAANNKVYNFSSLESSLIKL